MYCQNILYGYKYNLILSDVDLPWCFTIKNFRVDLCNYKLIRAKYDEIVFMFNAYLW